MQLSLFAEISSVCIDIHTIGMAGSRRKFERTGMQIAVAVVILTLAAVVAGAVRGVKEDTGCNPLRFVYPFLTKCEVPAKLQTGYYFLSSASSFELGGLEPEWDASNSTYYVRFTGNVSDPGAKYAAATALQHVHAVRQEDLEYLQIEFPVYFINTKTQRALKWRQEGSDEFFLIEEEVRQPSEGAAFRFRVHILQHPLCLFELPDLDICPVYYVISDPAPSAGYTDAGFLAYPEDGATYIKAAPSGSNGDLPIFIVNPNMTTSMPRPIIRTVTN